MINLCVFSGSSFGSDPAYKEEARRFGHLLAERDYDLVFGGGNVGLMGEVSRARAALVVAGDHSAAKNCGVDYLSRFAAYVDRISHGAQTVGPEIYLELLKTDMIISSPMNHDIHPNCSIR